MDVVTRSDDKFDATDGGEINGPVPATADSATPLAVQALAIRLDQGLYSLRIGAFGTEQDAHVGLSVPCILLTAPPSDETDPVDIMTAWHDQGAWIPAEGGTAVVRAPAGGGLLLATRYGVAGSSSLSLDDFQIHRLDQRRPSVARIGQFRPPEIPDETVPAPAAPDTTLQTAPIRLPKTDPDDVDLEITLHIERLGDRRFNGELWCGDIGRKMQIEALGIRPIEHLDDTALEYKAFAPGGRETPWLSGGKLSGTRGRGIPLIGFAVRVAPHLADQYEAIYQGAFFATGVTPPVCDGAPCLPPFADDLLEAVSIRVRARMPV
jgi:hypothetical protein